jgi:hypothetical protein
MQTQVLQTLAGGKPGDIYDNGPRISDPFILTNSSVAGVAATGKIVFTANPTANDTITVANVTYKFVSELAAVNDVKIGTDLAATVASIVKVVNGTATAGTDCYTGTKSLENLLVAANVSNTTLSLTAVDTGIAGNYIALASSSSNGTITAFASGVDAVAVDAYVGYYFSVLASDPSKAQAGYVSGSKTGGILVNGNQYSNWQNLNASQKVQPGSVGDILSFGRVIVKTAHDVVVGYLGCFNSTTGAIGAAAASDSVPAGYTLIPNSKFVLTNASANGLAILQLGE